MCEAWCGVGVGGGITKVWAGYIPVFCFGGIGEAMILRKRSATLSSGTGRSVERQLARDGDELLWAFWRARPNEDLSGGILAAKMLWLDATRYDAIQTSGAGRVAKENRLDSIPYLKLFQTGWPRGKKAGELGEQSRP